MHRIFDSELTTHLAETRLSDLPGVGYKTTEELQQRGCVTCADVWAVPKPQLKVGSSFSGQLSNEGILFCRHG